MYANVGDNAIWLGTRAVLRDLQIRIQYAATQDNYAPDTVAARLGPEGIIVLQGGGNFGDLYPRHQDFRENVVRDFPHHKIIQLPQTINFQQSNTAERARRVLGGRRNLILLVRDEASLDFARRDLGVVAVLCPDMAFALGPLARSRRPSSDVLCLWRQDQESAEVFRGAGSRFVDWAAEPAGFGARAQRLARRLDRRSRPALAFLDQTPVLYDLLARQRFVYGRQLLSRGMVVATDRLHGHILSVLLGVPHVLVNDRYGKVRRFYEAWTRECTLTRWSGSVREAVEVAHSVAREL